jgi:hypothetical protein
VLGEIAEGLKGYGSVEEKGRDRGVAHWFAVPGCDTIKERETYD